jgi:TRAP-type C4-dicarboxylate transport system permease small subunit
MSDFLTAFVRFTQAVNRVFLFFAGAIAVVILAIVANDVVRRSVFDDPTMWGLDYSRFALVYLAFLGLAPALQAGTHVNVDLVEQQLSPRIRRWVRLLAILLILVFGIYLFRQILRTTIDVFEDDSLFPVMVDVKQKEVFWIGPVGMAQFLLTGLAQLITEWRGGGPEARDPTAAGA